ncbi:hypothetical protein [Knoellia subterranea]|nr:hypothetical protein [Knoellia subterranea]
MQFLKLLDTLAHGDTAGSELEPDSFVDEYLLPKVESTAENGWPDWAVLWPQRVWVIELKTEAGSHRPAQLPYYSRLAAAAHPHRAIDLTYITGPLTKPAPELVAGQRYSHLVWSDVLPLVETVWGSESRPEVGSYVQAVANVVSNLARLRPMEQRLALVGEVPVDPAGEADEVTPETSRSQQQEPTDDLLALARATASDGRQRGVGAASPEDLTSLKEAARSAINAVAVDDPTRFVMPWVWDASKTGGRALTAEGTEFGYELRFSRYKTIQIKP